MKQIFHPSLLSLCLALAGCNGTSASAATTSGALATSAPVPVAVAPTTPNMDDLRAFESDGTRILSSQIGDLNGDGRPDALVVLDPPTASQTAGQGPSRAVLLLIRNGDGHLQVTARNDKIVPCERCGGIAGDPFGYARIDKEGFTLVTEGGSRDHWWNEYTFKYAAAQRNWMLEKVQRGVRDKLAGSAKEITLNAKDFGTVRFEDFDPSTLPQLKLP